MLLRQRWRKRILIVTLAIAAISLLVLANAHVSLFILLARTLFSISAGEFVSRRSLLIYTIVRTSEIGAGQSVSSQAVLVLGGIVGASVSGWLSRISLGAPIYRRLAALYLSWVCPVAI